MKAITYCSFILAILLLVASAETTQAAYPIKVDTAEVSAKVNTTTYNEHAPKRKNKLAQWSLMLSAGGFLFTFLPVVSILSPFMLVGGVVTGIIALGQIKKNKQKGSGLAIAALIIGGVSILAVFAAVIVLLSLFN